MNDKNLEEMLIEWHKIAKKYDDLQYVLITYGRSTDRALPILQKELKKTHQSLITFEEKMDKTQRFLWPDTGAPYLVTVQYYKELMGTL
jgi:hypothetical protein